MTSKAALLTGDLGVLLYVLRDWSYEDQALAIYNMRNHIRTKFQDIRMRNDIIRELWNFVNEVADEGDASQPPAKATSSSKKGKKSRARKENGDDDMDLDYRPSKQSRNK